MDNRQRAEAEIERRSRVMREAARFSRWGKPEVDSDETMDPAPGVEPRSPLEGEQDMQTVRELAAELDVMGGIGHESLLTDEAKVRRRAAQALVSQDQRIADLEATVRDQTRLVGILVARLGGEVAITDAEIVGADDIDLQTFRTEAGNDVIVRSRAVSLP